MEMFEEAVRLFTPYMPKPGEEAAPGAKPAAPTPPVNPMLANPLMANSMNASAEAIMTMQRQMMDMQKQLAALAAAAYTPRKPDGDKGDKGE